ncbi:hypothetical protein [Porphyrobacter sp. ULC335]|uniref:hypothetical protein n=1 Tax=Porphyrobacter sp. ULC335 TaxID=2854260 RepID=UPI00221F87DB|nr:hypothetical protein [Porphyrobacter sp. ULC335]UYV17082.1 hypothetical protein KVF90_07260 [Porphyrobacter sp. ULC335]
MHRSSLLACMAMALALPVRAEAPAARPVMVGGYGDLDACPSMGAIIPLRKGGDGYVAVRAAPSRKARELDRLKPGRALMLCRESADGQWIGVIYPEPFGGAGPEDCGVSSAADGPPRPYEGVCLSGWVARRYVMVTAG